ncbi:MAG: glycosyltransferase family 2 protein [Bdellovibrionales bacterium]|nr:glycosyltransferase family 2 protein [Bdellovibrionales bacterium]
MSLKCENWYLLRWNRHKSKEKSLALFGGLSDLQEKPVEEIKKEFEKALNHGYEKICCPWNFIYHSEIKKMLAFLLEKADFFVLSVHRKSFLDFKKLFNKKKLFQFLTLNLILEDDNFLLEVAELESWNFTVTITAHKGVCLEKLSQQIQKKFKKNKKNIYLSFPCSHEKHPELYEPEEIACFLKKDFYPPPPFEAYNLSIPKDLKLEPSVFPEFFYKTPSLRKPLKASVVIPAYNCFKELSLTLKHLYQQDLSKELFEVIVVDDGSSDSFSLKKLDFLKEMNFKFLFLPRVKARTGFKDHRFRAGIARNIGVRESQGENLFFLDADILVPSHYLSTACRELKKHPVILHPRYHLKATAPLKYREIVKEKHSFIRFSDYWETFYKTAQDWNQRKLPWKYISTNTLCLKAKVFKQIRAFRKNYTCYGFEDTDLGYRLYQKHFQFQLHSLNTYHLYRKSEFLGQKNLREELLGLSALTFFYNTHCLNGYEEFKHLITKALSF